MSAGKYGIDLLAFAPHPDDVELFCGGVMIRAAEQGHTTGIVDLTRGELASHGTPEERALEAEAAGRVLGLSVRENLGLPDGGIDATHLGRVVEVLRRRRPEIVLAPWIEERHPDHVAAGHLLTKAVFFAGLHKFQTDPPGEPFVPRAVLHYEMRYRMRPSFIVNTSAAWERKTQAIACHASQVTRRPGEPPTLISSSRALAAIEARDRYYGGMIGAEFGEALRSAATLGVVDLVAHFRANPFGEAHAFEGLL